MKKLTDKEIEAKIAEAERKAEKEWQELKAAASKLSLADLAFALHSLAEFWEPENYSILD